ncbi:uncharacterized protein LOC142793679 [Rhipicephalus microplus]
MWRKEYYSDIGPSFFTVPSLGWRERVAQSGWNTAVSRKYTLDFCLYEHAYPCFHQNQYGCGTWAQRRFESVFEALLQAFQRVVTGMAMSTQASGRNQNPSQRASRTNTSWIAFWDSNEIEELGEEKKEDGDSRPLVSNTRCSGMHQEDASRPTTMQARDPVVGRTRVQIHPHLMNY